MLKQTSSTRESSSNSQSRLLTWRLELSTQGVIAMRKLVGLLGRANMAICTSPQHQESPLTKDSKHDAPPNSTSENQRASPPLSWPALALSGVCETCICFFLIGAFAIPATPAAVAAAISCAAQSCSSYRELSFCPRPPEPSTSAFCAIRA
jgi:hypothetical protein